MFRRLGESLLSAVMLLTILTVAASSCLADNSAGNLLSVGKSYTLSKAPHSEYLDTNGTELTDGAIGSPSNYRDPKWMAVWGTYKWDLQMDLGAVMSVSSLRLHMCSGKSGIQWPNKVTVSVSDDGRFYWEVGKLDFPEFVQGSLDTQWVSLEGINDKLRYIKLAFEPAGKFTFISEVEVYGL